MVTQHERPIQPAGGQACRHRKNKGADPGRRRSRHRVEAGRIPKCHLADPLRSAIVDPGCLGAPTEEFEPGYWGNRVRSDDQTLNTAMLRFPWKLSSVVCGVATCWVSQVAMLVAGRWERSFSFGDEDGVMENASGA